MQSWWTENGMGHGIETNPQCCGLSAVFAKCRWINLVMSIERNAMMRTWRRWISSLSTPSVTVATATCSWHINNQLHYIFELLLALFSSLLHFLRHLRFTTQTFFCQDTTSWTNLSCSKMDLTNLWCRKSSGTVSTFSQDVKLNENQHFRRLTALSRLTGIVWN